ncbi:uncharacterized protein LOC104881649 isoform X1 [Vitis vinifera]|uniref:uncharacterized protein LOC104881649 isoform X1 n=2 Tax=Vitis vinifera TaxID=29760 RepID=UPI00053F4D95|nr:uncharacterized protein LOC104881649 isoform X1 [Vitis vinifera]|eukprot:XP_010660753.1 PREDICTED: uncharacterized protein LOC104881649 isoform X1 [Vitis vinifera]
MPSNSTMGLLRLLLQLHLCIAVMVVGTLKPAESTLVIRFDQAPPARSRFSTAVFRYSVERSDGSNACRNNGCSIYCELDGQTLRPCPADTIALKNLTVNREHKFLLNITTPDRERNSSAYSWFIDTIPPTATIFSHQNYMNAQKIPIDVIFSEACPGQGGFKCVNSSNCDVIVNGPASINASSLRIIKPKIKYSLDIILSPRSIYARLIIEMAVNFCTDQAGNHFTRTNGSVVVIHIDRRSVEVDLWMSAPSYMLEINGVPRTILATNKIEDLNIFLDFSKPVLNSTEQILKALHVNSGNLIADHDKSGGNRRFVFKLKNIMRTEIITIELRANSIIGRTGAPVSAAAPVTFLYDSTEPAVGLSTNSPMVTKQSYINVIVEFTKPVFGFEASIVKVEGGRVTRFKELSRALYSLTVLSLSHNEVSVTIPAGKVNDISGNRNLASNRLEVKHYLVPEISIAFHSFVTAGVLATSLAAAVLSLSSANLGAVGTLATGSTNIIVSNPSMNLHGMVGHLQVFVLSDWFSVGLPIEYSETTKGLRWLIPREKLPWKKENPSIWPNHFFLAEKKLAMEFSSFSVALPSPERAYHSVDFNLTNLQFPARTGPKASWFREHNISMENIAYGSPLNFSEYLIYFLRGEPLSANNVVKRMENYKGWEDLEMNLFWLGVGGGSLIIIHILILIFLRWRTGTSAHGILSVPRFELFLLILMLPCISQSSAFVIRGGTTGGIIVGALLLAIPAALIFSVCLFLIVAIFSGSFAQYKEVRHTGTKEEGWCSKLWVSIAGRSTTGKWFYREGLPSTFLQRFGILFESRKGPPLLVLVDQNDLSSLPKWTESGQSGIGRMRALSSDDSNEETKIPMSKRLLGCARSSYIIFDLLRRVTLGIISGAYSSHGSSQSLIALSITLAQFLYLFTLKPYIRRGVHIAESVSLLCEAGIFGLSFSMVGSNPNQERTVGFVMLALLFLTFSSQLVNEWYALMKCLLRLSQPQKNSFKLGLKCAAQGLVLPFLPRKHWWTIIPLSSQPKTGPAEPLSCMTATVVPVLSPGSPFNANQTIASTAADTILNGQRAEGKQPKGVKLESKSEMRKLRELARASFSGNPKGEEGSTSYAPKLQCFSGEASLSQPSFWKGRL